MVSEDGVTVDGIISERDILRGLASHVTNAVNMKVSELMMRGVLTCSPEDECETLMSLMTEHRIRHLPVVKDGILVGIISIGDVVKHLLAQIRAEADAMHAYISSAG